MAQIESEIHDKTIALIDSLRNTAKNFGLAGTGSEYNVIVEMFLYKYFNDKFGYEAKRAPLYGDRLANAEKWDAEYDTFTDDEVEDLFSYLPSSTPKLRPEHTLAHIYNASTQGDFSTLLDNTLAAIANLNRDTFAISTSGDGKVNIFDKVTDKITDSQKRDQFAIALVRNIASFNFESVFEMKYDFFSSIFEYLIKDFYAVGGGQYAEYYTPQAIAMIMARLLVNDGADLKGVSCYDPTGGTGTLLMAIAHQVGEERCSIYSQDISNKSSEMLRLNLILNGLSGSLPNIVQGNTLTDPAHKTPDGKLRQFDYVVSNPPFKLDFSEYQPSLATDGVRFWAGVPGIPNKKKEGMAIYTCFIQHVVNSINATGRGAIVVPTGFITSKTGVEKKILETLVEKKIVYGVVSMPSQMFATTGTNTSVLFFDKSGTTDKVVLMDASKLGEDYKDAQGNKRHRFRKEDIDLIINTFRGKEAVDDFSVVVTYAEIKEKGYSLSAGQYFDIKLDYVDITEEDFNSRMANYKQTLAKQFAESHELEKEIMRQIDALKIATN